MRRINPMAGRGRRNRCRICERKRPVSDEEVIPVFTTARWSGHDHQENLVKSSDVGARAWWSIYFLTFPICWHRIQSAIEGQILALKQFSAGVETQRGTAGRPITPERPTSKVAGIVNGVPSLRRVNFLRGGAPSDEIVKIDPRALGFVRATRFTSIDGAGVIPRLVAPNTGRFPRGPSRQQECPHSTQVFRRGIDRAHNVIIGRQGWASLLLL